MPCVGLGSRSGNLAQNCLSDEWIDVADFERLVRSTAVIIERWCGTVAGQRSVEDEGGGRKRKAEEGL